MNYTIQELAIKYAEAAITARRALCALNEVKTTDTNLQQLREREYDAWDAVCDARQKLHNAIDSYVDSEQ